LEITDTAYEGQKGRTRGGKFKLNKVRRSMHKESKSGVKAIRKRGRSALADRVKKIKGNKEEE